MNKLHYKILSILKNNNVSLVGEQLAWLSGASIEDVSEAMKILVNNKSVREYKYECCDCPNTHSLFYLLKKGK